MYQSKSYCYTFRWDISEEKARKFSLSYIQASHKSVGMKRK